MHTNFREYWALDRPPQFQDQLESTMILMKARFLDIFTTGIVWFAVLSTFNAIAMLAADIFNH